VFQQFVYVDGNVPRSCNASNTSSTPIKPALFSVGGSATTSRSRGDSKAPTVKIRHLRVGGFTAKCPASSSIKPNQGNSTRIMRRESISLIGSGRRVSRS